MTNEREAIEAVVEIYLDGLYEGDAKSSPGCFIRRARSPTTWAANSSGPRDEWLEAVRNRPTPVSQGLPRHDEILQIDQAGPTTAFVKVKCAIPPRFFTDYLSLLKIDGRWQVAQKVFAVELRDAARAAAE
jgi:hypothetical protein